MQQITVNLEDSEMALLQAIAWDKKVQPSEVLADHIKVALGKLALDAHLQLLEAELQHCAVSVAARKKNWSLPYWAGAMNNAIDHHYHVADGVRLHPYGELDYLSSIDAILSRTRRTLTEFARHAVVLDEIATSVPRALDAALVGSKYVLRYSETSAVPPHVHTGDAGDAALAARRAARRAALQRSQGIWKGAPGESTDGVKIQEEMRAEWQ